MTDPHRWLIAGTTRNWQYPCRCQPTRPCTMRCPCRGRTDPAGLPATCCARRAADTRRRKGGTGAPTVGPPGHSHA